MDSVKVALGGRGMTVEVALQCVIDRNEWKALFHMYMIEFKAAIFAWPCVLSGRLPALWYIITSRGVGYGWSKL